MIFVIGQDIIKFMKTIKLNIGKTLKVSKINLVQVMHENLRPHFMANQYGRHYMPAYTLGLACNYEWIVWISYVSDKNIVCGQYDVLEHILSEAEYLKLIGYDEEI